MVRATLKHCDRARAYTSALGELFLGQVSGCSKVSEQRANSGWFPIGHVVRILTIDP
jgi:hypothetical protein